MKKRIIIVSFIIGIIILVIGLYFLFIKAGIPYQDATVEMLQVYNRNMKIGEVLTLTGFFIELVNAVVVIVIHTYRKTKSKR